MSEQKRSSEQVAAAKGAAGPLFSANLGFLWKELPLPDAIRAAHAAGFDAVECHWPYDQPVDRVRAALAETGLPVLGINTRRGDVKAGEAGLSAVPGRQADARALIDESIAYAVAVQARNIHVMAGNAAGPQARDTFVANLIYAADAAAAHGLTILIEPLNRFDAPGYFLTATAQALDLIKDIGRPNLKLMFDCYHVHIMQGDLTRNLEICLPDIGHIQFASVPGRGRPDTGDIDYAAVFCAIADAGYTAPLGAEYNPRGPTEDSLGWMSLYRTAHSGSGFKPQT